MEEDGTRFEFHVPTTRTGKGKGSEKANLACDEVNANPISRQTYRAGEKLALKSGSSCPILRGIGAMQDLEMLPKATIP